jgi:glycosyltransferase involved in cell wall biosynthesis
VLPYLLGCADRGHRITVLSFEKHLALTNEEPAVRALCVTGGIDWLPLPYHHKPPVISTVYDVVRLTRKAFTLNRRRRFDLVHCRSYVAAVAALKLKRHRQVPLLFDMRGFWPDERVDSGSWDLNSRVYRTIYHYFKRLESDLLHTSDHIVSLTETAKETLLRRPELAGRANSISVIPTSVDFSHFIPAATLRDTARTQLGIDAYAPVLGYLGSLGGSYMLTEMMDFFSVYERRNRGARFLLVTMESARSIFGEARRAGVNPGSVIIRSAGRDEVPKLAAAADLGIAFKRASFSAEACAPTKLGEMLAMGIPMVANSGVGDVERVIERTGGGTIIREFNDRCYADALNRMEALAYSPGAIRAHARKLFDLNKAVDTYSNLYSELATLNAERSRE